MRRQKIESDPFLVRLQKVSLKRLELDVLNADAWASLAQISERHGRYQQAMYEYLFSALVEPENIESWCNAIILSFRTKYETIIPRIIVASYARFGEEIVIYISSKIKRAVNKDVARASIGLIRKVIDNAPKDIDLIMFWTHLPGPGYDQHVPTYEERTITYDEARKRMKRSKYRKI
jgi:hypothetical protein